MKKYILIHAIILITIGLSLMASSAAGQDKNEFSVPLSDPAKRGKIKATINNGSITIKGTARKDVLVKYSADQKDDDDDDDQMMTMITTILRMDFAESAAAAWIWKLQKLEIL